jgi:hypothetical protein
VTNLNIAVTSLLHIGNHNKNRWIEAIWTNVSFKLRYVRTVNNQGVTAVRF